MRIVVTVASAKEASLAAPMGPDLVEARVDLMEADPLREVPAIRSAWAGPLILTNRSAAEGGGFRGDPDSWWDRVAPLLDSVDMVDIERPFRSFAGEVRRMGKGIIASCHSAGMPSAPELAELVPDLRRYGDIPKIVVTPGDRRDILALLRFTLEAEKPICTGVLGTEFRYVRLILPFFGSELAYTHAGTPGAPGQFSIEEFRLLLAKIGS